MSLFERPWVFLGSVILVVPDHTNEGGPQYMFATADHIILPHQSKVSTVFTNVRLFLSHTNAYEIKWQTHLGETSVAYMR